MTTRISKIARLPIEIREQLNRRLHNGQFGRTIVSWVNEFPETKTILAEFFNGHAITHQNLSEWRRTGYQDWLLHQFRLDWFDRLKEQDTELNTHDGCGDTFEAMGSIFLFEIGQGLIAMQKIKNPNERAARLQNLTRDFSRLQNSFNWSRRVQLEWHKFKGPEPEHETPEKDVSVPTSRPHTVAGGASVPASRLPVGPHSADIIEITTEPALPLGAPASRRQVDAPAPDTNPPKPKPQSTDTPQNAPRNPEATDQHASVSASDAPPPLSEAPANPQPPKGFQAVPTPAPTTPTPTIQPIAATTEHATRACRAEA